MNKKWMPPLVAALALSAAPAWSALHPRTTVDIAPPAPQEEVMPPAREGYVWAPGYWDWRDHHHTWVQGHWVQERRGYHYEPAHWASEGGHWNLYADNWVHDEDGKDPTDARSREDGTQQKR